MILQKSTIAVSSKNKKRIFEETKEEKPKEKVVVKKKISELPWKKSFEEPSLLPTQRKPMKVWKPKMFVSSMKNEPMKDNKVCLRNQEPQIQSDPEPMLKLKNLRNNIKSIMESQASRDEDLENILNYEESEEMQDYESKVREEYLVDDDDGSEESSETGVKRTDSFSSLMNIFSAMRRSTLSKSVSESRLNLMDQMKNKPPLQPSQIDIAEIPKNAFLKESYQQNASRTFVNDKSLREDFITMESSRSYEKRSSLNDAKSFTDISRARFNEDLDEEDLNQLSVNNKLARSMFEQSAPRYKFGGSLSNINNITDKTDDARDRKVMSRKTSAAKDKRSWVLEAVNKHFDIIVEEDDEDEENDSDSDDYCSSLALDDVDDVDDNNDDDDDQGMSSHMRGLVKSVIRDMREKDQSLTNKLVLDKLKRNLMLSTKNTSQV